MFKIPNHEQFMTTIGKLNFFRWAFEANILDYIEAHEEEIRAGYNAYLKETTQTQKRNKNETATSTESNITTESVKTNNTITTQESYGSTNTNRTTRRRRTKQSPSSLSTLQISNTPVELGFD
jgi:hypothetical protein